MQFLRLLGPAEYRDDERRDVPALLAQPKRLALLAYLAAARPSGFHRRDTLIGLFWPELDQHRGRAALRQSLYTIRRAAGAELIASRGDDEIGIAAAALTCDVREFHRLRGLDPEAALALYRGDLLQGLFVREAPEFERWLELERARLRSEAAATAWQLASSSALADPDRAIRWAGRAAELDPFDERAVRRLMQLFADAGQGASALRVYAELERRLARDLDTAPSAETRTLAARLRTAPAAAVPVSRGASPVLEATSSPEPAGPLRGSRVRRTLAAVLAALVLGCVPVVYGMVAGATDSVVAGGALQWYGEGAGDSLTQPMRAMLGTNLARVDGVAVISDTRLLQLSVGRNDRAALAAAARRAGAKRLLEGMVVREHGYLRLSLQWTDLRTGRTTPATAVREDDAFAAVNAATSELARTLGRRAPALALQHVTTPSLAAYRWYEAGVRALFREQREDARVLFRQALAADSVFAQAWWYYSRTLEYPERQDAAAKAFGYADRASDRERLMIRAQYLADMDDPRALAVADTLSVRYPSEPIGPLIAGYARMWRGDFTAALSRFRAVVRMDTASIGDTTAYTCYACLALWEIHSAYGLADSPQAQLRHARAWVRADPTARGAWFALSNALEANGRWREAVQPLQRGVAIVPVDSLNHGLAELYIRAGEPERVDSLLAPGLRARDPARRSHALWTYIMSLRNQGRYDEALSAAREYREIPDGNRNPLYQAGPLAQVLLEMGRARDAAALFDSIAGVTYSRHSEARNARACTTDYTRSAEAYYALRDTAALKTLLPRIERCAAATSYGPGRLRGHHVRGLLEDLRGNRAAAARAYRAAMFSTTNGDTRLNAHLARVLIESGAPEAAVPVLNSALRASVGGPGYYIPQRRLHELAERAWRAAGQPDSAARHSRWLARVSGQRPSFSDTGRSARPLR